MFRLWGTQTSQEQWVKTCGLSLAVSFQSRFVFKLYGFFLKGQDGLWSTEKGLGVV